MPAAARRARRIKVGNLILGGGEPVRIQSMCSTMTSDAEATVAQILRLEEAGCEIVRVACPTEKDAYLLGEIKKRIHIPLVADVHFNYRLALIALDQGIDKLRLNPGNIGSRDRIEAVVSKAKERRVPIRIGVNSGSLEKDLLEQYGRPTAEALVESASRHVRILEKLGFFEIVVSLKASDVPTMVSAYRLAAKRFDYPLHLGVTEAGTFLRGSISNAVGIGALLLEGIGDTIRVSLSADAAEEVRIGRLILEAAGLRTFGPRVIACPSCGRAEVDVLKLAGEVEARAQKLKDPITISVLGCVVNGPGEAREADFGIAGGKEKGMIYVDGKAKRIAPEYELVNELFKEIATKRELDRKAPVNR